MFLRVFACCSRYSPARQCADAQCRLCGQPTVVTPTDTLANGDVDLQIEARLNFDRLILSVRVQARRRSGRTDRAASRGRCCKLALARWSAPCCVHGDANRPVRVDMPRRIELFSVGGRADRRSMTSPATSRRGRTSTLRAISVSASVEPDRIW